MGYIICRLLEHKVPNLVNVHHYSYDQSLSLTIKFQGLIVAHVQLQDRLKCPASDY